MAKQVDVIKKFVDVLTKTSKTGTDAVNEAMKAVGATSYNAFKSKFVSDQSGLSTQDFLERICGVRVNNTDTGAITGSDAGGSTTKTAASIVPETAAAKELTDDEYSSFTKNGLKVNIRYNAKNDIERNKQRLIARALYNWWVPESLDLINESLGINFTDGRANINEITIKFANSQSQRLGVDIAYDLGRASNVTLTINTGYLSNMTANDKNGYLSYYSGIYSPFYGSNGYSNLSNYYAGNLDQLVLHALTMVALTANVSYVDKLPREVALGLFELVGGYDSVARTINLSNFLSSSSWSNAQYYGYTLMRYLAKNYSEITPTPLNINNTLDAASITGTALNDTIKNSGANVTINALGGNDVIISNYNTGKITINGGKGNDTLDGGAGNDSLTGGAGNDSIFGGAGNDVLIGGEGKDVIYGFANNDMLLITGAFSGTYNKSTKEIAFKVGSTASAITLKDFTATSFNINGYNYGISDTKLVKK